MFLGLWCSSMYFFGMSGIEKCVLQLCSSWCFSVQRHEGFSVVVPVQISMLFTITPYNTIESPWKYFVPLPRSNICILAIRLEVMLLLLWNVWKFGSKSALDGKTWNQPWSFKVVSFGQRQLTAVSHRFRRRHWTGWKCLVDNIVKDSMFCSVSFGFKLCRRFLSCATLPWKAFEIGQ